MSMSMSANDPATQDSGNASGHALDLHKLHSLPSEQQDLYLLTFTAELACHVELLDLEGIIAQQKAIKKELFQIISLSSPAPTRVIRRNICHCFAVILQKGDRKPLFETINELGGILSGKGDKDRKAKHAAASCMGAVFDAAGDSAVSLSSFALSSLLRVVKTAQTHSGFRGTILLAIGKIFQAVGTSADESIAREAWKQARSLASNDKAHYVQASACICLEQLSRATTFFDNPNDFEKLQTSIWKALDSPSSSVRRSAASCLAVVLVKGFSESSRVGDTTLTKRPKKAAKKQPLPDEDKEITPRPDSATPQRSETHLSFNLTELFAQLSAQYAKASNSDRFRAGIAACYVRTVEHLGKRTVESHYGEIALHLFNDVLSSPTITQHRYRQLTARKYVRIILEDVVSLGMLGEEGQIAAAKFLLGNVIKDYPPTLKERPEPSKEALIGALSALGALIESLGAAATIIAESCRDGLIRLLQHPSYSVQLHASFCLRSLVLHSPQQILPTVTICLNSVRRELAALGGPRKSSRSCVGFANGLSAAIRASSLQSLYGSVEIYARVMAEAVLLLKSSSDSDLRISSTQIQVAWILIGGLMSLGPNFVKIHLNQLLLLWRNALAKPLSREIMVQRDALELSFLAHVRECALGAFLSFLEFNGRLLTADIVRRLAAMLQNTTVFLNSLPAGKASDDLSQRLSPALALQDFDVMVRRRVLQCYHKLVVLSAPDSSEILVQSNLLPFAISSFADPENYVSGSLSSSIAGSSAIFDGIWDMGDNYGFGITGLVRGLKVNIPYLGLEDNLDGYGSGHSEPDSVIDQSLLSPVCGAREHDSIKLYNDELGLTYNLPDPPATEVVNAAISLFGSTFPIQSSKVQESILEQLSSFLSSTDSQRDPARKLAITVNVATALLATMTVAVKGSYSGSCDLRAAPVQRVMQELLHDFVVHHDTYVRNIACLCLALLCNYAGGNFVSAEVTFLVDQIISNREPTARAGCAVALGCIHSQLGGMAASYHLKNILGVLMSLSSDPHSTVHFWALQSLAKVADSAGLSFSSYVSSTLGMLARLYTSDTHNEDAESVAFSNSELEQSSVTVIARCVDSLINILGPDLQDAVKLRDLVMILCAQFQKEDDSQVVLESLKCQEHVSLYVPALIDLEARVAYLQKYLSSDSLQLRSISLDGIHNLMRRDAEAVINAAESSLEDKLWITLNREPGHDTIRRIFGVWLQQSGVSAADEWVHRCQKVLYMTIQDSQSGPTTAEGPSSALPDLQDEEVAGFATQSEPNRNDGPASNFVTQELLRWQVRSFAMDCLSELLCVTAKNSNSQKNIPAMAALQSRVADLIRMAFSASTASVVELRLRGMRIIDQVLMMFGKTPDPEFTEVSLLEQYQAQVSSALTPAFATDSAPELAAKAIHVCATFISTGMVKDVERMGRILKLLISALETFSGQSEPTSIGELKGLSPNAQVMVKMATFSAWAKLQIASADQDYLLTVVEPYTPKLTPLWLSSLAEYARLRFEPDDALMPATTGVLEASDSVYAALSRQTVLSFYQDSWLEFMTAIASLVQESDEPSSVALSGTEDPNGDQHPGKGYRHEPAGFFFVLFGLAFEALASRPTSDSIFSWEHTHKILQSLKKLLQPSVCGRAIYQEALFSEATDLFDKLILTEGLPVQSVIVEIARDLCLSHPLAAQGSHAPSMTEEKLSEDIDQLFELTRLIVLTIVKLIPRSEERNIRGRDALPDNAAALLHSSLSALVDVASVFPSIIKTDLHACIIHVFVTILSNSSCQVAVVPQALPILRRFLISISHDGRQKSATLVRSALRRFLWVLKYAQRREFEAALACEKNTLLAITVLLAAAGPVLNPQDPLVLGLAYDLFDCLGNRLTTQVAAGCCRSLMTVGGRSLAVDMLAARLLPLLINFLVHPADTEGLEASYSVIATTLCVFISTLEEPTRPPAVTLIVHALLDRACNEGRKSYGEIASRLLELANLSPVGFKLAVERMSIATKQSLEDIIKEGRLATGGVNVGVDEETFGEQEPSIALKMEFGAA